VSTFETGCSDAYGYLKLTWYASRFMKRNQTSPQMLRIGPPQEPIKGDADPKISNNNKGMIYWGRTTSEFLRTILEVSAGLINESEGLFGNTSVGEIGVRSSRNAVKGLRT